MPKIAPLFSPKYDGLKLRVQLVRERTSKRYAKALHSSEDVVGFLGPDLSRSDREMFLSILLNSKNVVLGVDEVSVGCLDVSVVHPREVFKTAILASAASLVFVHNHPSGNPEPSQEDLKLTERLVQAAELLGIKILDHIIIGGQTHLSMYDTGILPSKHTAVSPSS